MVKSDKGQVCIKGNIADIGADIGCLIVTYKDILLKSGLSEETANNMIQTTADAAINYRNRNKKAKNQDEPVRAMLGLIKGVMTMLFNNQNSKSGCPCVGCEYRNEDCHAVCQKYKTWCVKQEALKLQIKLGRQERNNCCRASKKARDRRHGD